MKLDVLSLKTMKVLSGCSVFVISTVVLDVVSVVFSESVIFVTFDCVFKAQS